MMSYDGDNKPYERWISGRKRKPIARIKSVLRLNPLIECTRYTPEV